MQNRIIVRFEGFEVVINQTDEGIVIDVFDPENLGDEFVECIASTYAFSSELKTFQD